jgi:hypothetical protein
MLCVTTRPSGFWNCFQIHDIPLPSASNCESTSSGHCEDLCVRHAQKHLTLKSQPAIGRCAGHIWPWAARLRSFFIATRIRFKKCLGHIQNFVSAFFFKLGSALYMPSVIMSVQYSAIRIISHNVLGFFSRYAFMSLYISFFESVSMSMYSSMEMDTDRTWTCICTWKNTWTWIPDCSDIGIRGLLWRLSSPLSVKVLRGPSPATSVHSCTRYRRPQWPLQLSTDPVHI